MKRYIFLGCVAVLTLVLVRSARAEDNGVNPIPPTDQLYTYAMIVTNAPEADAGTTHPIWFEGEVLDRTVSGEVGVPMEPGQTEEVMIGSFKTPLTSLQLMLNGLAPTAPDNWRPVRIQVIEWLNGEQTRVVIDHNPWQFEFNDANRIHPIF